MYSKNNSFVKTFFIFSFGEIENTYSQMSKTQFSAEFEINASNKMLYPYLNTASGLAEWFAEDVTLDADKNYYFVWDGVTTKGKKAAQKINQYVKFEFYSKNETERKDLSYVEFKLDVNEMTQTSFLKITDYSEIEDPKDLRELWNNLVSNLKEKVGG